MSEPRENYAKQKASYPGEQVLHNTTYMRNLKYSISLKQTVEWWYWRLGREEMGEMLENGTKIQLFNINNIEMYCLT